MKRRDRRQAIGAALVGALLFAGAALANAADTVHVGKANGGGWTFLPADIGIAQGIFAKYDIALDTTGLAGDAKVQQGLIGGSIDFGLGSGPAMAFVVKGAPIVAVAAYASEPRQIALVVLPDSPIRSVADVKGKIIGISTVGSLTEWLAGQMAIQEGWGKGAVKTQALGDNSAQLAALKTHQVDGVLIATEAGYVLEEKHDARIVMSMEKYAPHFHAHVIFARKQLVDDNPGLVERFLKGFFASIAYMKTHKAETSAFASQFLHESVAIADKTYDHEIGMLEDDGRFDPQAVAVLAASFVDMGILPEKPRDDQLFTTRFVPVKP